MNSQSYNHFITKMHFWNESAFSNQYSQAPQSNQVQLFYPYNFSNNFLQFSQNFPHFPSNSMLPFDNSVQNIVSPPLQPEVPITEIKKTRKEPQKSSDEEIKVSRNTKSLIIRQFLKFINKDASKILEIKELVKSELPIKQFLEILDRRLKKSKQKYIRASGLRDLCCDEQDRQFSLILRIILKNFLSTDFQLQVLSKKKNKAEYMKGKRELLSKLFSRNVKIQEQGVHQ